MHSRLAIVRDRLQTGLWPIPIGMTLLVIPLYALAFWIDGWLGDTSGLLGGWMHSGSGDDARNLLSTLLSALITMAALIFSIMIAALSIAGISPALAADVPCTSLLQKRVLDLRDTRSPKDRVAHVRDVLCQPAYADIADLKRLDRLAGGTLEGALAIYGFRGDGLSWQFARKDLCGARSKARERLQERFVELRAADRGLMQAFRECVKSSRQLEIWVELGPYWTLTVQNRAPEQPRAPRFLGLATSPEKDLCSVERGFVINQVFRDDQAFCRYHPSKPTAVTLSGDRPVGKLTIDVPK